MKLFKCTNCGWIGEEDEFLIQSLESSKDLFCPLCESTQIILEKHYHNHTYVNMNGKKQRKHKNNEL